MKKIGIIGGLGPESTLVYYRGIIDAFHPTYSETGYPEIILESVNLRDAMTWAANNEWHKLVDLLSACFHNMELAGADFGAIASNTPHIVFAEIQSNTKLPLLSIVAVTRACAQKHGLKKMLLLGTGFTMASDFYQREFEPHGIEMIVPHEEEREFIHKIIFSELELGIVKESTRAQILSIINSHKSTGIDGVILACTELPLSIKQSDLDLVCLDTGKIHIDAIAERCLQD
jgi:aspartate racemase